MYQSSIKGDNLNDSYLMCQIHLHLYIGCPAAFCFPLSFLHTMKRSSVKGYNLNDSCL